MFNIVIDVLILLKWNVKRLILVWEDFLVGFFSIIHLKQNVQQFTRYIVLN